MMLKIVVIFVVLNITCRNAIINCLETKNLVDEKEKKPVAEAEPISENKKQVIHIDMPEGKNNKPDSIPIKVESKQKVEVKEEKLSSTNSTTPLTPIVKTNYKSDLLQSGALLRGFYVFLGLSVITVFYLVYRSYRLRHGSQPSTTVRKYGITARRSDMEMRRLELDDEDDDTLFEVITPTASR